MIQSVTSSAVLGVVSLFGGIVLRNVVRPYVEKWEDAQLQKIMKINVQDPVLQQKLAAFAKAGADLGEYLIPQGAQGEQKKALLEKSLEAYMPGPLAKFTSDVAELGWQSLDSELKKANSPTS